MKYLLYWSLVSWAKTRAQAPVWWSPLPPGRILCYRESEWDDNGDKETSFLSIARANTSIFKLTWIRGRTRRSPGRLQWSASRSEPQTPLPERSWWLLLCASGRRIWTSAPGRWRRTGLRRTESAQRAKRNDMIAGVTSDQIIWGETFLKRIIDQLTFPMARRALSKNSIIPKKRKNTPNPVSPIPISVDFKKKE